MKVLEGKRVLVTAGAAGIGRAMALAFCDAGARVEVCGIGGPTARVEQMDFDAW
ncbi:hypothetical protein V4F39_20680 [Aquincola sp. MAHUQ-54]|uniref:SDR family NAD(P)-dependent oxidoreductase n=1 Tax=Aquincola agrisoli TaxID=3119538 RepID=A0AAW9QJ06_9BURK